jgi:hypothetical protein
VKNLNLDLDLDLDLHLNMDLDLDFGFGFGNGNGFGFGFGFLQVKINEFCIKDYYGPFVPNRPSLGLMTHIFGWFETVQNKPFGLFSIRFFAISGRFETVQNSRIFFCSESSV